MKHHGSYIPVVLPKERMVTMKASELIKLIESECKGQDPEVEFFSYEWDDDLEDMSYHERDFEKVSNEENKLRIYVSR